jgi:hypothetical protein
MAGNYYPTMPRTGMDPHLVDALNQAFRMAFDFIYQLRDVLQLEPTALARPRSLTTFSPEVKQMATTQYMGVVLTLPLGATKYNLYSLLQAIDPQAPSTCSDINIQADYNNTDPVLVGDASVSPTRFGVLLSSGGNRTYARVRQDFPLGRIWLYVNGSTANQKINVEVAV